MNITGTPLHTTHGNSRQNHGSSRGSTGVPAENFSRCDHSQFSGWQQASQQPFLSARQQPKHVQPCTSNEVQPSSHHSVVHSGVVWLSDVALLSAVCQPASQPAVSCRQPEWQTTPTCTCKQATAESLRYVPLKHAPATCAAKCASRLRAAGLRPRHGSTLSHPGRQPFPR